MGGGGGGGGGGWVLERAPAFSFPFKLMPLLCCNRLSHLVMILILPLVLVEVY